MKEVLRLVDVSQEADSGAAALRGYNLEVFAGEIVVVFGMEGSGLRGLLALLNGSSRIPGSGRVYIDEQPAPLIRDRSALWDRIFILGDTRRQFENLSVAENLALLSTRHSAAQLFNRESETNRATKYLREQGLDIDPSERISALSFIQRQKLNLLLAKMVHASLIVVDCMEGPFQDKASGELIDMMHQFQSEGMAFLLISYRDEVYDDIATRLQRIAFGRDIMEWKGRQAWPRIRNSRLREALLHRPKGIEGIWDEAISYTGAGEYLRALRRDNGEYWEKEFGFPLPPEGRCEGGGTVLVPRNSAHLLVENLTIEDNVILPIPKRVKKGPLGYIPQRLSRLAAQEFYRATEIDPSKRLVSDLSFVERKILSLYRWEQARPAVMVLEIPDYGLDRQESQRLNGYLSNLAERDIRVIILSDSMECLLPLCERITISRGSQAICLYELP